MADEDMNESGSLLGGEVLREEFSPLIAPDPAGKLAKARRVLDELEALSDLETIGAIIVIWTKDVGAGHNVMLDGFARAHDFPLMLDGLHATMHKQEHAMERYAAVQAAESLTRAQRRRQRFGRE